jgi:hypothetical protein
MTTMKVWQPPLPVEWQVSHELSRSQRQMQAIAQVTKGAIDEIGVVHRYAQSKAATTLEVAQQIHQAASVRGSSPSDEAAFQQATRDYLAQMHQITESASTEIVLAIHQVGDSPFRLTPLERRLR